MKATREMVMTRSRAASPEAWRVVLARAAVRRQRMLEHQQRETAIERQVARLAVGCRDALHQV